MKIRTVCAIAAFSIHFHAVSQSPIGKTEILGRPTDTSVTISALFSDMVQVYFQYGTSPGVYTGTTAVQTSAAGTPVLCVFSSLQPDRQYYYRSCFKRAAETSYTYGEMRTFHTQRKPGSSFKFTIESDPHPYDKKGSHTLLHQALKNQLADSGDFLIDMGDTFGDDHNPTTITSDEMRQLHSNWRAFFGSACHSSPLFLCIGNHEGENGYYLLQTPPNNLGIYGTLWRKFYFPNPVPDGFYSGNTAVEGNGIGAPENYFGWTWGDALFIVLDAYRYFTVSAKPRGWDWTIGKEQYDWFKKTLETSKAKYKFVFTHHTLGETRGGIATAKFHEWGGYEANGTTYTFAANRPGWELPIHQLMVKNGVSIFFQGHDHIYVKEELDGIVYQAVPMPSDSTYIIGMRDNGDAYTGIKFDGSGHLRVAVSPANATVEYISARLPADETALLKNRTVVHSYSVLPKTTSVKANPAIPASFTLEQNYPNPFNPSTGIRYSIPSSGFVQLSVYDMLGRETAALVHQEQSAGSYDVAFDGRNQPSGIYVYQLRWNGMTMTKKAVLTR